MSVTFMARERLKPPIVLVAPIGRRARRLNVDCFDHRENQ
ncbi:hypothetical protein C7S16_3834 [Burkholderia thailandensis]|uniref:Uncharacterized protein n=1 Tax=Burkholderia thailandensis TaxID=57975 RepID=A0AAW9CXW7_BURTH|nr:hypothetical protein [Burkholderia thailandensis]